MRISQQIRQELQTYLEGLGAASQEVADLQAISYSLSGEPFVYLSSPDKSVGRLGVLLGHELSAQIRDKFESAQTPSDLGGRWAEFVLTGELSAQELIDFIKIARPSGEGNT